MTHSRSPIAPRSRGLGTTRNLIAGGLCFLAAACGSDAGEQARSTGSAPDRPSAAEPAEPVWLTASEAVAFEPSATLDARGRLWICWLDYQENETRSRVALWCAVREEGRELARRVLATAQTLIAVPQLAPWEEGAYVVWEAGPEGKRALFGRSLECKEGAIEPGERERLTPPELAPLAASVAGTRAGRLDLVCMALEGTSYDLVHLAREASGWSAPQTLEATPTDEWNPVLAPDGAGGAHLVFDRWNGTDSDVWYARLHRGALENAQAIAAGPDHQAEPQLSVDPQGRAWIAWEETAQFGEIGGLRTHRRLRLGAVVDGRMAWVPAEALPEGTRQNFPRPVATPQGLLVLWRDLGPTFEKEDATPDVRRYYTSWFTRVASFAGGATEPETLEVTDGDGEATERVVVDEQGRAFAAFAADSRTKVRPKVGRFESAIESQWRVGVAPLPKARGFPPLVAEPTPPLRRSPPRPAQRPRPERDGERVFYGDLHRHTQLSRCSGAQDGSILDAYRYARGAGALDFLAITDHFQHLKAWSWWRSARDVARFHAPGSLVSFVGIERMLQEEGHFNEIFLEGEGVPFLIGLFRRSTTDRGPFPEGSTLLIPHMFGREKNAFAWKDYRPGLHRVFEVFQGRRGSYEGVGLPYEAWDLGPVEANVPRGQELGHHFGLIAASDHNASSHGLAGVWAPEFTREALFRALRDRRTFASTEHLAVDASLGSLTMGTSGRAPEDAPFLVHLPEGRAVASVEVIKNGQPFARLAGEAGPEHFVLTTRRWGPWADAPMRIAVEGAELVDWSVRAAGEHGAKVEEQGDALLLSKDRDALDLVLVIELGEGPAELVLDLKKDQTRVDLKAIPPGRSFGTQKPFDREWVWRVGPVLESRAGSFAFEDPDRQAGDSYYARVAWSDGNLAWTSPIRVEALERP